MLVLSTLPSASALYEELTFHNLITDDADYPAAGFNDIISVDVAEPGDDTLIVRFTVADFDDQLPNECIPVNTPPPAPSTTLACGSVDLFLDGPSGFRQGMNADGTGDSAYESCEVDGDASYCIITYENLGLGVGGTLAGPRAISYWGAAQDYAPGGTYAQSGVVNSGRGTDYTLQGCTATAPGDCAGAAGDVALPGLVHKDLPAAAAEVGFTEATSDDYVFNFTNDLSVAIANFDANGTGFANATLIDSNGMELYNGTVETGTVDLGNVTAGDWQLLVDFTEFNGTFAFELMGPQDVEETAEATDDAAGDAAEADADGGDALGNETVDGAADDAEAPGPTLPFMAVGLMAVAFLARRRF